MTDVLVPAEMLGKAARVTVTCRLTDYRVDPLTMDLQTEGKARNVFSASGNGEGLAAFMLPQVVESGWYFRNNRRFANDGAFRPSS